MSIFILQSLFLIAAAYLLGAIVGCWIRKLFKQSASMLHRASEELAVDPVVATAGMGAGVGAASAIGATRYAGEEGEASIEIKRPDARNEIREEIRREPPVEFAPIEIPVERETISFVEPEIERVPDVTIDEIIVPAAVETKTVVETIVAPVPEPVIDDLTRIKGVGLPVALELKKNGITRFEQVARWNDADIDRISEKLGFSGRIERENWMAQARILATGNELEFTTHQLTEAEENTPSRDISKLISAANYAGEVASSESQDDLKRIVGIGTNVERLLKEIGVTRFSQIAAWSFDEVDAVSRRLDIDGRIDRENWVQQARNMETLNT